jgi:hypothetical protein
MTGLYDRLSAQVEDEPTDHSTFDWALLAERLNVFQ